MTTARDNPDVSGNCLWRRQFGMADPPPSRRGADVERELTGMGGTSRGSASESKIVYKSCSARIHLSIGEHRFAVTRRRGPCIAEVVPA